MVATNLRILVVDDDEEVCRSVSNTLTGLGHTVRAAHTLADARTQNDANLPDAVFLDLRLPDGNGVDYLEELKDKHPQVEVIVITGYPDVDLAVRSMRLGAIDLIEKPFTTEQIAGVLKNVVSLPSLGGSGAAAQRVPQLIGNSPSLLEACQKIHLVASTPSTTALILGESGTGKELAARAIHVCSSRASGAFVAVNCAALTESLLEAELFGYEKGAFTGAATDGKPGLFEVADGGTIFLDEIGEMDLGLQAKLLRVLQEHAVKRVGGLRERKVDVRVVASTNRELSQQVAERAFREDLFYRLNVMPIRMPPLRERGDDVSLLAHHYLKVLSQELGKKHLRGLSPTALDRLLAYPWPGNVRELRNVVENAVIVARGPRIEVEDLMIRAGGEGESSVLTPRGDRVILELADHKLASAERALIELTLAETGGQKTRAAEMLGINRATLYNKLKAYDLE